MSARAFDVGGVRGSLKDRDTPPGDAAAARDVLPAGGDGAAAEGVGELRDGGVGGDIGLVE